jgi:hypothetical protein
MSVGAPLEDLALMATSFKKIIKALIFFKLSLKNKLLKLPWRLDATWHPKSHLRVVCSELELKFHVLMVAFT